MSEHTSLELRELRRRIGDLSQLVSTRATRLSDGNEDGTRVIDARAAGGISALILADRGLDLGPVWAAGHQVSWQSPTGVVHPAYYHAEDWLRSFHGGMLLTCGLQNVGLPSEDEGRSHGLHGRISHVAARDVTHRVVEEDGRLVAEVSGEMRETDVFGADLRLRRRITLPMGETVVHVRDEVVNEGFEPAGLMLLYHVNVGYPVVADDAVLITPPAEVTPRDENAARGMDQRTAFPAPRDGFVEHVFRHELLPTDAPSVSASIVNPRFEPTGGIGLTVSWDPRELPRMWQWRMLGPGMYVTGLEPANCTLSGRAANREEGTLEYLEPGARRSFGVSIRVSLGQDAQALAQAG
ncbi:MAG: aldose 1-epimerase family protein [Candidatus Limnocylindrales bacterium]